MGRALTTTVALSGAAVTAATIAAISFILVKRQRLLKCERGSTATEVEIIVTNLTELEKTAGDAKQRTLVSAVDLRQTCLVELPVRKLRNISHLIRLDIGGCGLARLDAEISKLQKLQVLLAPRNKLTEVPAELGRLTSLVQLDLGTNHLTSVPPELCQLSDLHTLNLMNNQLETLPEDMGRLSKLRLLGLKSNKLVALPASISQLTNLVELFITDNRLQDLPPGMSKCTSLVKLQASFNAFTDLPACLLQLPRLELLRVAVCAIRTLPEHLLEQGAMPQLAWFSVAGNPVCPGPPAPAPGVPVVHEDDLELGLKLGDGASGEVYRAVWQGQLVAVKFFRSDVSPDGRTEDEVALAMSLQHPHLTQVLAKVSHPPGLVLRLEQGTQLAHKPTSQHLLRCKWGDDVRFSPRRALLLAVAVADALAYCHAAGICHGDVYAHNVLMDEDENVTLCDFGASFSYDSKSQLYWQAMEVRAYGLMLLDVVHRCGGDGPAATLADNLEARIKDALKAVADRCADLAPAERPSFAAVCQELRALRHELLGA